MASGSGSNSALADLAARPENRTRALLHSTSIIAPYALTDRQRRIVTCAREWLAEHGAAPTMRELGVAVGLTSTSSVAYQL
ncbi:hypothetical protein [Streptomyces sp. NPDC059753]|uniref:LexA family protein n=1 Tax=Streptomyces sp. NPDC059753 TaxID=3346933 RepID=UPI00365A03A8